VQRALRALEPLVQQQQQSFDAWGLTNIIHACHHLNCKYTMLQLLPVFLQPPVLARASAQGVANVLWAAVKSGIMLQDSQVQQLLERLCAQLHEAAPQAITNSVYAVAEMGNQLPGRQLQQLIGALCGQLNRAKPQELANSLWAVAKMGQQVPHAQLQQLLDALCSKLQQADPQSISNTLWAVATMGQQVPPQQLQQLLDALCSKLDGATPQNVSNTLWACGCQFKVLPSQLLTALEQQPQQLQRLLAAATAQNLANMTLACAWLYFRQPFLLNALLQQAAHLLQCEDSRGLNCQDCANLCWSVVVLDLRQHAPKVLQLAAACSKQWGNTIPEQQRQFYHAHRWLLKRQLPAGSSSGLAGVLTQQQLEQCRTTCEQQRAAAKASKLQRSVFDALKCLPDVIWQQQLDMEQQTADTVIDIAAVTAGGVKLAVEVDGPSHFVQPGNQLDGQTQHRNRMLAACGYTVVSIPYWEWNGLPSKQQQVEYLQRKLAEHL
jgi:very-short-patch-repair endonuclease